MSHAFLSPSGAERWIACPPSVMLEKQEPKEEWNSPAASKGTLAHKMAEIFLKILLKRISFPEYLYEYGELMSHPLYGDDVRDMVHFYVKAVKNEFYNIKGNDPDTVISLEKTIEIFDGCWGTADCVLRSKGKLQIIDLKTGKWPVDPKGNPQLKLYAYGVLKKHPEIMEIKLTIVQDGKIKTADMTAEELRDWIKEITPRAEEARRGEGAFRSGKHCKFCNAINSCPLKKEERKRHVLEVFGIISEENVQATVKDSIKKIIKKNSENV